MFWFESSWRYSSRESQMSGELAFQGRGELLRVVVKQGWERPGKKAKPS